MLASVEVLVDASVDGSLSSHLDGTFFIAMRAFLLEPMLNGSDIQFPHSLLHHSPVSTIHNNTILPVALRRLFRRLRHPSSISSAATFASASSTSAALYPAQH
eukprot:TRINITY_DN10932_c1_g3_i2.p7 TRINITY_DN10932_c1_g3~~TRINITY_DN10932_c1_g3_i2.p7  ORF type:complete len:103 (+),score=15.88 TRINITY_DN10932_c1_g3_i2:1924-2232(+)